MNLSDVILPWTLAVVLAVSGLGKLLSLTKFEAILRNTYGIAAQSAILLRVAVPALELGSAVLLVPSATRPIGYILVAGFALSALVVAASALLAGRAGDCGCFGELSHRPLARGTILQEAIVLGLGTVGLVAELPTVAPAVELTAFVGLLAVASGLVVSVAVASALIRARRAIHRLFD